MSTTFTGVRAATPLGRFAAGVALLLVAAGCAAPVSSATTREDTADAQVTAAAPAPDAAAGAMRAVRPAAGPLRLDGVPHAAWARGQIGLFAQPSASSQIGLYPAHTAWGGSSVFLVQQALRDRDGEVWMEVLVPRRPNGTKAWVRGRDFILAPLEYRVQVDVSERRLRLLQGDRVLRDFPVAVGAPATPTPLGQFFVTVKLRPPAISRVYGDWALGLSGYSDVLDQFGTGDGQIALHGTRGTWALGQAVSNGCVRLANADVSELARLLPPGTPVTIVA